MNELKPPDMPLTLNANFNPTSASGRESRPSFDTEEKKASTPKRLEEMK